MQTQIRFVDGDETTFGEDADVKMTAHGVEVIQKGETETIRVLFPWNRIKDVTQRGAEVSAIYTY